jgi:fructose-bisphosphate aldolase class II
MLKFKKHADKIIPGFNVFGMDDTLSIVKACDELNCPVFLMTNKESINRIGLDYWGAFLKQVKTMYNTNVYIHLDHCTDLELIKKAIDLGYDSVMYDGSQLPLEENIEKTKIIVDYAHAHDCLVEGEVGSVSYATIDTAEYKHELTDPIEAKEYVDRTGVDLLAVSIGTVHKLVKKNASIDYDLLEAIASKVNVPLVLHGFSSVTDDDIEKLKTTAVTKVNIGTYLRKAYGLSLRQAVLNSNTFDRYQLTQGSLVEVYQKTLSKIKVLGW